MPDIISTVSSAITLATRLREISKNIEDAEFKNVLADLSLELAETKMKMSELLVENAALKEKLHSLASASGERCPKCNNKTFQIISTKPHRIFGDMGTKEREYQCSSCGSAESRLID